MTVKVAPPPTYTDWELKLELGLITGGDAKLVAGYIGSKKRMWIPTLNLIGILTWAKAPS